MKSYKTRNTILALTGLAALVAYVLACTSFSPDDTQVLYPAFDSASGVVSMAVYNRETGKSDPLFLPMAFEDAATNRPTPSLMRAQWLKDGRSVLLAFGGGKDDTIHLALLPWKTPSPVRLLRLPKVKDGMELLAQPLCVSGDRLFWMESGSELARLDLKTGELVRHSFPTNAGEVALAAGPDEVFYRQARSEPPQGMRVGRLNPDDFTLSPAIDLTNDPGNEVSVMLDARARRVALLGTDGETNRLEVFEAGKVVFQRRFGVPGFKWEFGSAGFLPNADRVWATYEKTATGTNVSSFGLVEIPLSDKPVVETSLVSAAPRKEKEAALYFQGSVSHDGKTLAVASTYLALVEENFAPADCALFLVDLSRPERKVTRVAVPVPGSNQRAK